jgi:cyclopropane fatty-acyl-phospholipid synthase-like methyltransferase
VTIEPTSHEAFATVRRGYDQIGPAYREWSQHSAVRLAQVQRLLDRLPAGSTVLELGCGPGEPATRLLSDQHHVIGVDASLVQLQLARTVAPRALLVQGDMAGWHLQAGSVDAVASFYALGHLPAAAHAELFSRVGSWLRPGGLLLTSAPLGVGDDTTDDWLGVPMFFGGIGEEQTREAVRRAGLVVDAWDVLEEDEGAGVVARFLWLLAHREARA